MKLINLYDIPFNLFRQLLYLCFEHLRNFHRAIILTLKWMASGLHLIFRAKERSLVDKSYFICLESFFLRALWDLRLWIHHKFLYWKWFRWSSNILIFASRKRSFKAISVPLKCLCALIVKIILVCIDLVYSGSEFCDKIRAWFVLHYWIIGLILFLLLDRILERAPVNLSNCRCYFNRYL